MTDGVRAADAAFFAALLAGDAVALDAVLAPDFTLVDVMAGSVVAREALVHLVGSGELEFRAIVRDPADASVRERPGLGVVVGRTRMTMRMGAAEATVPSRYTHVFVDDGDGWRLLAAQGTREAPAAEGEES